MIPIPTNESISQMTLLQLNTYLVDMLKTVIPNLNDVETNTATCVASAETAQTAATSAAQSLTDVNAAVTAGLEQINSAVATVLNTEV